MKKYRRKVTTDHLKRLRKLNAEIQIKLLRSVLQSKNTKPFNRVVGRIYLQNLQIKSKNNLCLLSGRFGGVFKKFNFSRHNAKKLNILNKLQNFSINS